MKGFLILVLLGLSLSSNRDIVVSCAKKQLNKPYKRGGQGPDKFDCIGLVKYCLDQIGKGGNIGSVCHYQYKKGKPVNKNQLQPGDAVFFDFNSGTPPGHVGIYIGNDYYINASTKEMKVVMSKLSANTHYYGARNYID